MALAATTCWEVMTTGSDTLNGGAFDPSQVSGMFTDGAATSANTSAPVFTSASYNFVAGDVGAWVFIASGTNWTPGWYKIASVGSNAATLSAAIGAAVGSTGATTSPVIPSTIIGCATVASPTGATWSIDYSQQAAAQFAYTDLTAAGAGLTCSSAAKPFAKQQVGNSIVVISGTNATAGRYVIASVAAAVATVVGPGNIFSGAGAADGVAGQGGALASPGACAAVMVGSNQTFVKTGTYTIASATINIATGCFAPTGAAVSIEGYATVRGDLLPNAASGTRPTMIASGISTFTLISMSGGAGSVARNLILDGASLTSSRGMNSNGGCAFNVHGQNFTNGAFGATSILCLRCSATGCTTVAPFAATAICVACVAYSNTVSGFTGTGNCIGCISYSNSGATSDGFNLTGQGVSAMSCVAYGNGRDGFRMNINNLQSAVNCIAEGHASGVGFNVAASGDQLQSCAVYNNSTNVSISGVACKSVNQITGTSTFFVNAAGGNFALNNTATGGGLCRSAGYPGTMPVGLSTGYLDIGAIQHQDAGGGGSIFNVME